MSLSASGCDVICLGLLCADYVCAPAVRWPQPGTLVRTSGITLTVGGSGANLAVDLAKLGVSVALVGKLGNDPVGGFLLNELQQAGVDCSLVGISESTPTAGTLVINVEREDRRFIHFAGAGAELTGLEVPDEVLAKCKVVCVAGIGLNPALSGRNVAELFRRAKACGATTLMDIVLEDPQQALAAVLQALPVTDLFLPNTDEARLMTGLADPADQAAWFLQRGARTVVITQGAQGALLHDREAGVLEVPAYHVEQLDATGGGDAFDAGYVYGLLRGASQRQCLAYGSAMGASCVRSAGATTGVFNSRELEAFVRDHPPRSVNDVSNGADFAEEAPRIRSEGAFPKD